MSNDKKNKNKGIKADNKIVQFPAKGEDAGGFPEELFEDMIPEFLDAYLPVCLEFASITAVEIMNFSSETLEQMKKAKTVPREILDIIFIKLRGLSIIVPSSDISFIMADMMDADEEDFPDLLYAHEVIDEAIDLMEELVMLCMENKPAIRPEPPKPIPVTVLKKHDAKHVLEVVHSSAEEVLVTLGEFAEQLFEWSDDES